MTAFVRTRPRPHARAALAAATLLASLAAAAGAQGQSGGSPSAPPASDPTAGLTVRQLIGQRVIYAYAGTRPPLVLEQRIRAGEAAGVILFARNIASRPALRATMRRLQAIPRPAALRDPLLVMIDQEGGLVKRLSGAPLRAPADLGRIGSIALARSEGQATARNLLDVGVNVNLAPVVDTGRPGSYQQRTRRSYSSRSSTVSALGSAFVRGMQERGVAGTLKHFPGLGTVTRDEDALVQVVSVSLPTLRAFDEAPFAAGIRAGAALVMTSTARYPGLSPRPALLSPAISTTELRTRLGFRGVSITDDLEVPALRRYGPTDRLGLLAAQAGNDLLLYAGNYVSGARAVDLLSREVAAGRLSLAATRASVRRVLALRAGL